MVGVDAEWRAVMEYANKRPHASSSTSSSASSSSSSSTSSTLSSSAANNNHQSNNNHNNTGGDFSADSNIGIAGVDSSSSGGVSINNSASTSTTATTAITGTTVASSTVSSRGASILQIATPHCVLVFDLKTLSQTNASAVTTSEPGLGSGLGLGLSSDNVCDQAVCLLQSLFSRDDVIKVG